MAKITSTTLWFSKGPTWLVKVEHFIRCKIFHQKDYLIGTYKVEDLSELKKIFGLDAADEIADDLENEITKSTRRHDA